MRSGCVIESLSIAVKLRAEDGVTLDSRESLTRPTPPPNPAAVSDDDLRVVAAFQFSLEPERRFAVHEHTGPDGYTRATFGPACYAPSPLWRRFEQIAACRTERERSRKARAAALDFSAVVPVRLKGAAYAAALERVVRVLSAKPARTNGDGRRPPYPSPLHLARALAAEVLAINRKTVRRRTRIEVGPGGLTTSVFVHGKRPWPESIAYPSVRLPDEPNQ